LCIGVKKGGEAEEEDLTMRNGEKIKITTSE
jgi:hypothetical protein